MYLSSHCWEIIMDNSPSFPEALCVTPVTVARGLVSHRGDGLFTLPTGSTQTRHIPEDTPNGFHLQSVSKLLLVISCV